VLARICRGDAAWRDNARDAVLAGLLHDVGMIRTDPTTLANAGALDDEQKRGIAGHAHAGARRIIARLPDLSHLAEVAACHHERANGTGYPMRLCGDQLAPLTRLVAAVDVYAAMCAPRSHREAIDPRAALTDVMLMAERGQLDQKAAAPLLSLGLYPCGTVVELANGATAVVLSPRDPRSAYQSAARPTVAMLADATGRPFVTPRFLDLANADGGNIIRTLNPFDRLQRLGRSYPEWT
jgi:HD-GYP domain-containing protein (c-di-GMP phosphodiesterase class II)